MGELLMTLLAPDPWAAKAHLRSEKDENLYYNTTALQMTKELIQVAGLS